ncbi:MAG: hypothetical protein Sylvanvirus2_15 [Sylvanvirus sp.]|uniref:Uncharacterized protein n=1 Tax=Sylvanvirus sp. TaxID=2487774 RepID=A0A3G5AKR4_9VIRU|nr:MAG: hypothetical protein Sylvanvirus2_15 [Sylvanvirus sp.]
MDVFLSLSRTDRCRILQEIKTKSVDHIHERLFTCPKLTVGEFSCCYWQEQQTRIWTQKREYDVKIKKSSQRLPAVSRTPDIST